MWKGCGAQEMNKHIGSTRRLKAKEDTHMLLGLQDVHSCCARSTLRRLDKLIEPPRSSELQAGEVLRGGLCLAFSLARSVG